MTINVGDRVKFTKMCGYNSFHEMGVIGVITEIFTPDYPFPYIVEIEQESFDMMIENKKMPARENRYAWPCKENEFEVI